MGLSRFFTGVYTIFSVILLFSAEASPRREYHEINLRTTPGIDMFIGGPGTYETTFSIGGHVTYFTRLPWLGVNVLYQYAPYETDALHRTGGGPLLRLLDLSFLRLEVESHASWVKTLDASHFSWGAGTFLSYPFKRIPWVPFIGPYVAYDRTYVPGEDLQTISLGLLLSITGKTDWD